MKGRSGGGGMETVSASTSNCMANGGDVTPTSSTAVASPSSSNLGADDAQQEHNDSAMDDDLIVQWILKAIDVIRRERQRPSLDRIVHKLKLKHDIDADTVKRRLDEAVKFGKVVKIYNQGVAYNDPVELRKLSNRSLKVTSVVSRIFLLQMV